MVFYYLLYKFSAASVSAGYEIAYEVLGGPGANDLFTPDQKKLFEAANKKKREQEASAAWSESKRQVPAYLPMAMAGGKRLKRDRTNSPCHLCQ